MTGTPENPPHSRARHERRMNLIWLIPIATLCIGAYLAWSTLRARGPTIEITFQNAEGLKAGQSQIRYKDVVLGTVQSIRLTDDFSHVVVSAEMRRGIDRMLVETTKLWVVKPRFFAGNVQGLDTLLSGGYINVLPGNPEGNYTTEFTGLEDPPVLQQDTPGTTYAVRAPTLGSLNIGSPVFFHDVVVGEVLGWDFDKDYRAVTFHVFVQAPYDRQVNSRTHFWNASGVTIGLGSNGLQIQFQSLRAVLQGGVAFNSASSGAATPLAKDAVFPLYANEEDSRTASYEREITFISRFEGSVRGLAVGSTVDIAGIKVGQVKAIHLQFDPALDRVVVPVTYTVQPERITNYEVAYGASMETALRDLVRRGLRAKLVSSSLITGSQVISMTLDPAAPPAELGRDGDAYVMPAINGGTGIDGITASAADLLAKINAIPFAEIGRNLNAAMAGASGLVNAPELHSALAELQSTLSAAYGLIQKADHDAGPALARLPAIAQSLQESLNHVSKLTGSLGQDYGGDSRFKRDLDQLLSQLSDTATSVRVLADLLTRHPEALIRGRPGGQ
jgi:paraquat-inducible protein B